MGEGVGVGVCVGTEVEVLVGVGDGVINSIEATATDWVGVGVGVGVLPPVSNRPAPIEPIRIAKSPKTAILRQGELRVEGGVDKRADGGTAWRSS